MIGPAFALYFQETNLSGKKIELKKAHPLADGLIPNEHSSSRTFVVFIQLERSYTRIYFLTRRRKWRFGKKIPGWKSC